MKGKKKEKREENLGSQRQTSQMHNILQRIQFEKDGYPSGNFREQFLWRNYPSGSETAVWVCSPECGDSPYCEPPKGLEWAGLGTFLLPQAAHVIMSSFDGSIELSTQEDRGSCPA